ncbi:PREDICTED: transcobalamin-2 [Calidris pugnax]|uniref:transcobalamin-2 n=1 Tax=Calidris pugnax TaxID=198806 RepID=UPI00071C891D|nr:PREDICTED: transcobalamin-2 [Calidris pugnax]
MWLLLVLLQAALPPAQPCEAPGEAVAVRGLSARLLGLVGDPARDPDPSVYLALRLAGDHDLRGEERYLARLQDTFQRHYGRSLQGADQLHGHPQWDAAATEHNPSVEAEWPETGRLALYLLGLRATCPPPDPGPQRSLVTWLKYYLEEDWAGSRRHGHPLTSYYQYSLGVLALCVHRKRVREEVIRRLLAAEHHGRFGHAGGSAVGMGAGAEAAAVGQGLGTQVMVTTTTTHGLPPAALPHCLPPSRSQVFIATDTCQTQPAYGRAMAALLKNLDAFTTTATMARSRVGAGTCLERERLVGSRLAAELRAATRRARRRMVEAQGPDGFFGNIYSTPWAMQVFIATDTCQTQPAYGRAMAALLKNLDAFTTTATMAQALPALHGHSYLDIASMRCQEEPDTLTPVSAEPLPEMLGNMTVRLVVECPLPWCPQSQLYDQPVSVPAGASLLDVLRAATTQGPPNFTFVTQDTPQGPFLSRVLGLEARQQQQSYWQLLTAPDTSLQMGVADYRPEDGETLILRLSQW